MTGQADKIAVYDQGGNLVVQPWLVQKHYLFATPGSLLMLGPEDGAEGMNLVPGGHALRTGDLLHLLPDGTIFAAGQGGGLPPSASYVAKVDPSAMKSEEIIRHPDSDIFRSGTVAIQVGKEIWVGCVRGDRIAIFPAAGGKKS